ncbi:hypothetical protein KR054_009153 [Drosophila jambulina]|nr:hypothetical protein KR054_009153 [Drosophila jambulina]
MKFFSILLLLCAVAGTSWSQDTTTTTEYWYNDPSSTWPSATTEAPQPPCGGNIQGPCGKFGGKKLYFFY